MTIRTKALKNRQLINIFKLILLKFINTLLLFLPLLANSQPNFYERNLGLERYIDSINQLHNVDSLFFNNEEFTTNNYDGGSNLTIYFHDNQLIKIKSWFGLSYGITSCEYYLQKDSLYLVIEKFKGYKYDETHNLFNYSQFDIHYNGWYIFKNNLLVDMTSLGHWRFEDDTIDPEATLLEEFKSYRKKTQ